LASMKGNYNSCMSEGNARFFYWKIQCIWFRFFLVCVIISYTIIGREGSHQYCLGWTDVISTNTCTHNWSQKWYHLTSTLKADVWSVLHYYFISIVYSVCLIDHKYILDSFLFV
jgi:hypothetical protein